MMQRRKLGLRQPVALLVLLLSACLAASCAAQALRPSPDQIYGVLYSDVERASVFADQKTFPDCVATSDPDSIVRSYVEEKARNPAIDLGSFVHQHFIVPQTQAVPIPHTGRLSEHLANLWDVLKRSPDKETPGSSLLPLPRPYVVPGGRFREVYYWDSYFTMLGLRESAREDLIEDMVENFAYELSTYGLIPNGNRTYYLSRSQPPFFSLMVDLLAERKGQSVYATFLPAMQKEYEYWTDGTFPTRHRVTLPGGIILNRYYDQRDTPRPESFATDEASSRASSENPHELYRNLRSAAESGWDFSSRWFADRRSLATIDTVEIVPVDLNCLLWHLEKTLARAYGAQGNRQQSAIFQAAAARRKAAIETVFWSEASGFYFDWNLKEGRQTDVFALAGTSPLFFRIATQAQADRVAEILKSQFLKPGGVVTTPINTGQQWDAPNGWAPLEWMTIQGLRNYHQAALAEEIAHRWMRLNEAVYKRTGRMMEKYNVEDTSLPSGGGEYPTQDGFGWTNGVLMALMRLYPE